VKPATFDYHRPQHLEEALSLLAEHGDEAKPLAGGQSLIPLMNLRMARFGQLVDLGGIAALTGIASDDGTLVLGAMTRQAAVADSLIVDRHSPLLTEATGFIGHFQIRNRGTIGGSLAHADPAAEYCAAALALDAEVEVAGPAGVRRVRLDDLLVFPYVTALAPDELLTSVRVTDWGPRSGSAMEEIARRRGDFALVGGATAVRLDETGRVERARVVLFGVGPRAQRLPELEQALTGALPGELDLANAATEATAGLSPPSDVLATGAYRRRMAGPLAARVVDRALTRARATMEHAG
jgi:carbon-monoxide dehydrogenase medium subunit